MKRWLNRGHLNRGGDRRYNDGYTIVETLIVLAVTAAMFSAILVLFRGRQARVEFSQAVRDYEAMLQNIVNDVSKGYFSSDGYKCEISGPDQSPTVTPDASGRTGTNGDCAFFGKVLMPDGQTNDIYPLIGLRIIPETGAENPGLVRGMKGVHNDALFTTAPDLLQKIPNTYQLSVKKIVAINSPSTDLRALVFTSFLDFNTSQGDGDNTVQFIAFREPFFDLADGKVLSSKYFMTSGGEYNLFSSSGELLSREGVMICLEGSNGQQAQISLGSKGSATEISTEIDTHPTSGDICA